jgi:hypothetical protein
VYALPLTGHLSSVKGILPNVRGLLSAVRCLNNRDQLCSLWSNS